MKEWFSEVADICIVGAGAAGLALASALEESGLKVLVLEAGGKRESSASQDFYRGETMDAQRHPEPEHYRVCGLGGSTRVWGGRCVPYDPIDFETRDWAPHSGWPFSFEELAPYYERANMLLEAGSFSYESDRPLVPGLQGSAMHTRLERYSPPTDLWKQLGRRLQRSPTVHVEANAVVSRVGLTADSKAVDHLELARSGGVRAVVKAKRYVLSGGGLETPRLLMASGGIGDHSDWLGRGYMCHVSGLAGVATFSGRQAETAWNYEKDREGVYFRPRLWVGADEQRRLGLLNTAFRLHIPDPSDPSHADPVLSAIYLARYAIRYDSSRALRQSRSTPALDAAHLRNIAAAPGRLGSFAVDWVKRRHLSRRRLPALALHSAVNRYTIQFHSEQAVNRSSRLVLSDAKDSFGMPRLAIDWRSCQRDVDSVVGACALLAAELKRTRAGLFQFDPATIARRVETGASGGHHLGATRMSGEPKEGVVDAALKVHGLANLWIVGGSVLPTSSHANPTLTVVALALRLADSLMGTVA